MSWDVQRAEVKMTDRTRVRLQIRDSQIGKTEDMHGKLIKSMVQVLHRNVDFFVRRVPLNHYVFSNDAFECNKQNKVKIT